MFVTFDELPPPQGGALRRITRSLRDKIKPPKPEIQKIEVCGSFFFDVRAYWKDGRLLQAHERSLLTGRRGALAARGLTLPQGFRPAVSEDQVARLRAEVLCNTLLRALLRSALPLYCRRVGLIDPECLYPFLLEKLIKYCPVVLVCTDRPERYAPYAERMLEEYGAPITFTGELPALGGCAALLDLGALPLPSVYPAPVFSMRAEPIEHNLSLVLPHYGLPEADEAIPPGIDRDEFYTALWQLCGVAAVGGLCASSMLCKSRRVTVPQIAAQLSQNQEQVRILE